MDQVQSLPISYKMETNQLEVLLITMKALEGSQFEALQKIGKDLRSVLEQEVNETRLDYLGKPHRIDLNGVLRKYPHMTSLTLFSMFDRLKQHIDKHIPPHKPSIAGHDSYLGTGQFSLLRTEETLRKDALKHSINSLLSRRHYGPAYKNHSVNILKHLRARELRGPVCIRRTMPTDIYSRMNLYKKLMGHLSSVYCVCFDQSGQYIFTGADDHLIKVWSARDGRLLKTLRGHDGEITDMSVNYENRLLASGGMDRIIRIWELKSSKLLHCLTAHSAMVTSVKFSPYNRKEGNDERYLISTSNDGSVIFWSYQADLTCEFKKLRRFQERNRPGGRIVCSSFSTGGSFLACGSSDNFIHIYGFHPVSGPYWMAELDHHRDQVDSIQFCNDGFRFISGSQDGTAVVWKYVAGTWTPLNLDMAMQLDGTTRRITNEQGDVRNHRVLIVQWSRDDRYVMTSLDDYSIKVWDSKTGKLVHILKEHKHDVYLLESHPTDPRIFISASHDGMLIVWDIDQAKVLKKIYNHVDNSDFQTNTNLASIYDTKFSPDGSMIAATDSYGYLSLYGLGSGENYKQLPEQMFFHTDYRGLIRDLRHFVLDEQTHLATHLMPRPTLVDMNGNPYPESMQRFVPDYKDNERTVVVPLNQTQIDTIGRIIADHSRREDSEFLEEKRSHPNDLVLVPASSSQVNRYSRHPRSNQPLNQDSRYNTRYSTRSSFRNARNNFMPRSRRARSRVLYHEQDEEEEQLEQIYHEAPRRRRRNIVPGPPTHSDSSTEEEEEEEEEEDDDDDETEYDTVTEVGSDDETVIDSDATVIDDTSNTNNNNTGHMFSLRPSRSLRPARATRSNGIANHQSREPDRPVRRCSARLRDRKRQRRL